MDVSKIHCPKSYLLMILGTIIVPKALKFMPINGKAHYFRIEVGRVTYASGFVNLNWVRLSILTCRRVI